MNELTRFEMIQTIYGLVTIIILIRGYILAKDKFDIEDEKRTIEKERILNRIGKDCDLLEDIFHRTAISVFARSCVNENDECRVPNFRAITDEASKWPSEEYNLNLENSLKQGMDHAAKYYEIKIIPQAIMMHVSLRLIRALNAISDKHTRQMTRQCSKFNKLMSDFDRCNKKNYEIVIEAKGLNDPQI